MPKLAKKLTVSYGRTDGWTDPNYRKASLLKIAICIFYLQIIVFYSGKLSN